MAAASIFTVVADGPGSPLHLAWRHTGEFWVQTSRTIAHHPVALLVCAAVPAAERGYLLLRGQPTDRRTLPLLEALVTLWRVFLCIVAVWAATSGVQWRALRQHAGVATAWQLALEDLGADIAHHLRMVLWEFLFLALALWLAHWLLARIVEALPASMAWLRAPQHRLAVMSVLRNLVFAPVLVIYLVEMARPTFQ